jgi:hypothetical protein
MSRAKEKLQDNALENLQNKLTKRGKYRNSAADFNAVDTQYLFKEYIHE